MNDSIFNPKANKRFNKKNRQWLILNDIEVVYREYAEDAIRVLNQCCLNKQPLYGAMQEQVTEFAELVLQSTIDYSFADENDKHVVKVKQECAEYLRRIDELRLSLLK